MENQVKTQEEAKAGVFPTKERAMFFIRLIHNRELLAREDLTRFSLDFDEGLKMWVVGSDSR